MRRESSVHPSFRKATVRTNERAAILGTLVCNEGTAVHVGPVIRSLEKLISYSLHGDRAFPYRRTCRSTLVDSGCSTVTMIQPWIWEGILMQKRMSAIWIVTPAAVIWAAIVVATGTVLPLAGATSANAQSVSACESYAHDRARRATRGTTSQSMARNALGAAAIGSLVDGRQGARRGANLGLGAGLLSGSISAYNQYETEFNRAFRRCMRI